MARRGWGWAVGLVGSLTVACGGGDGLAPDSPGVEASSRSAVTGTVRYVAEADARVVAAAPDQNFGDERYLTIDNSPLSQSYLRFHVQELDGTVNRATLRLYVVDGTSDGPRVFPVSNAWDERAITWNNKPAAEGAALADTGALEPGQWLELDVTAAVRGNGTYAFALVGDSGNGVDVYAREQSGTQQPELVIETSVGEEPPPPTDECSPVTTELTYTYEPHADAYVARDQPSSNFGTDDFLFVDASPYSESYLRVEVFAASHPITSAKLRLYVTDGSSNGPKLYRADADRSWSFTWNDRPAISGEPIADSAELVPGTWVEYDVSAVVQSPGLYAFGLLPDSSNGTDFASIEHPDVSIRPHLVVTVEATWCSHRGTGGDTLGVKQSNALGRPSDVVVDADGNRYVAGEGYVAKLDASGAILWSRALEGASSTRLAVTPLGNVLVAGTYSGTPAFGAGALPNGTRALFIAKFSPSGSTTWSHGFQARCENADPNERSPGSLEALDLATDAQGSLVVSGSLWRRVDFGGGTLGEYGCVGEDEPVSMFVAKFGWDGVHHWSHAAPGHSPSAVGSAVATSADSGVYLAGRRSLSGEWIARPFIARYSSTGALEWERLFPEAMGAMTGLVATDAGVAFAGHFAGTVDFAGVRHRIPIDDPNDGNVPMDVIVGALTHAGEDVWARHFPGGGGQQAVSLQGDGGGQFVLAGWTSAPIDLGGGTLYFSPAPFAAPFVAKLSATGEHQWSRVFDPELRLTGLDVLGTGDSALVGYSHRPVSIDGQSYDPANGDLLLIDLGP